MSQSRFRTEPPYGVARVGRVLEIVRQVEERGASSWAAKDISASRWTYRLRAWEPSAPTTLVVSVTLNKGSATLLASSGWIVDRVALGATAYEVLEWEIVEVDGATADADAASGFEERVLESWSQPIETAPAA